MCASAEIVQYKERSKAKIVTDKNEKLVINEEQILYMTEKNNRGTVVLLEKLLKRFLSFFL